MSRESHSTKERILLVDVSNSFTKIAIARKGVIGAVRKIRTSDLPSAKLSSLKVDRAVIASVVPSAAKILRSKLRCPVIWINHKTSGVCISYPKPSTIGADRLSNVAGVVSLGKLPAIVVDFGTAVTFDVIDGSGCYLGGIIAPGLSTAAAALHERTALLPLTRIQRISAPFGKSTQQAIRIGLLLGAVGIVREVVGRISRESFAGIAPTVFATGGDAGLVARLSESSGGKQVIDHVDPLLTLRGLLVIASRGR